MAFLDKMNEVLNTKGKDVVDKAKDLKDMVSLTSQVSSQENLINKYFRELGQFMYQHKGEDVSVAVNERYAMIDTAYEEVARLKKELSEKKGLKICPVCGNEVKKEDSYCSKCGAAVPTQEPEETADSSADEVTEKAEESSAVCPECGEPIDEDTVVCPQCGKDLQE